MNNAINMANMNPMGGGPVGAPMPMMNNGAGAPQPGAPRPPPQVNEDRRTLLNTYIYEYFVRSGVYDVARAMVDSDQPMNVSKEGAGRRRDENGNVLNGLGDDPMDTDSKDDGDSKLPEGLPAPKIPMQSSETAFLYDWFCLFWDIFQAQRSKTGNPTVSQYVSHTQQQSRMRQSQQQELLRNMRPDMAGNPQYQAQMMRHMQQNGAMGMKASLARTAMSNNSNNPQMLQLQQAKQNQMQRDPSDMDGNRQRPASPGNTDNAPSPSKRPRIDNGAFNPNQPAGMMPNGRPAPGMPGNQPPANFVQAQQMLLTNGINPATLTPQQMQAFANQPTAMQQKNIAAYSQNLQQHHGSQMPAKGNMPNAGGPQGQGSPMMQQTDLNAYYNAAEMGAPMRAGPGGAQAGGGSNHALQDYQMQLMLLEQQNKKRLMMARQEQDNMGGMPRADGPGGPAVPGAPGPNGQPFADTSPQARTGASPNPSEQMKRGTPQIANAGIPSPLPDGGPSRGSPNPMNFMGGVDPINAQNFFKGGVDGMPGNMVPGGQMNNMRPPPSSHPGGPQFNGVQMTPQQIMQARQQQQHAAGGQNQWQGGPNGAMGGPGPQGPAQGTPQQRNAMPPPSAPAAAAANANSRNNTSSPQQGSAQPPTPQQSNKAAPKKKADSKAKDKRAAAAKKGNANLNANAAAAAPDAQEEPPTPATPITPVNPASFNKGAAGASAVPNGQPQAAPPPAVVAPVAPPQAAPAQDNTFGVDPMPDFNTLEFANPLSSENLLNEFDFDSFLHDGDGDNAVFDFSGGFMEGAGEIGAD